MDKNRVRSLFTAVLSAVLLTTAAPLAAQTTGTIRGTVTDANTLAPLNGAQVSIVGTGQGTLTNSAGEFIVPGLPAGTFTVRVQMLGYSDGEQDVTVSAGQAATVDFQLSQSAIALDEVVVTGTAGGTQMRAIGNAVSSIDAAEITEVAPVTDMQELLVGRTPGLNIMSSSGQAGASSRIRIRGASSLSAGNEPVFIVDGVRMVSGNLGGGSTVQSINALDALNPNDIASIEVIKGPAAATLYGAEAAGGVIQIITKKGAASGDGIQWTADFEMGQSDWHANIPTTYTLCTEGRIGSSTWPGCANVEPGTVLSEQPLLKENECLYTENCQPNALRTGDQFGFNISASGAGEDFTYYLSGEHNDEEGVYYNNFAKRTAGRANIGFSPTEKLSFQVNTSYSQTHVKMPLANNSSNSILRNALRGRPGRDSPWAPGYRGFSPEISNQYDRQVFTERTIFSLTGNYSPWDWFQNRLTVGLDNNERLQQVFYRIDETGREPWGATDATGTIDRFLPERHYWTVDYAGTFTADITSDYTSDTSIGMQLNRRATNEYGIRGEGLVANNLNLVSSAAISDGSEDFSEQTSLGFYLQEQVGYKNRLFGTVAVRVDDNSAFGSEFNLVYYPKAQLSYVISEEDFFTVPFVDELRLRGAWGRAGNAPAPFSADRTYEPQVTTFVDDEGTETAVNQIAQAAYGNPNLTAETGSEIEVGFDAGFLDGRASLEFTYYNQHTYDALVSVPDPPSSGFTGNHLINIGEIANSGFEVLINATPVLTENVAWDAILSMSTNSNELISFGGAREAITFGSFADVQKHTEGYPLGGFWAVDVVRDANGNPVVDEDGDVTVDFNNEEFVGPMLPTRQVALSNTLTLFGNLRLYANLDYKGGNYQWCAICSINNRTDRNTWLVNDPNADPVDVAVYQSLQTKEWIYPADFLKLRELSATYSLPSQWANAFRATAASFTLSGRNLWMWTNYGGPNDPEVAFDSTSGFGGTDYASTPMMRRLSASLRFVF
ncbi:MAG TPA: SusC/RagA family TonB-linked outer membrane protein [Longimicrobiaceae bacterium]|nr:SusC/RagA family TonB-linked outer membrane protein [Longimicrobiaceae bacterium]